MTAQRNAIRSVMKPLQGNTPKDLSLSFPVLERVNHRVPSYPETPLSDIYLRCASNASPEAQKTIR